MKIECNDINAGSTVYRIDTQEFYVVAAHAGERIVVVDEDGDSLEFYHIEFKEQFTVTNLSHEIV